MAITPVNPLAEPFDPLDELLNSRYLEIDNAIQDLEAADAALRDEMRTALPSSLTITDAVNFAGGADVVRVGNMVMVTLTVTVKTANYLCSATSRKVGKLPAGYRPVSSSFIGAVYLNGALAPTTRAQVDVNGGVWLVGSVSATQPANVVVIGTLAYVTVDARP